MKHSFSISLKLLTRIALLAAISLILGKFLSFKLEPWGRISLENLSVLLCGYLYGPLAGALCGAVGDLVGCLAYGYSINPIITLGAASIGTMAGLFGMHGALKKPRLWLSVASAHLVGSLVIKSIGIYVFYATPLPTLALRIPIYLITGTIEFTILYLLLKNKGLRKIMCEL